jgi:acetyltransferase-like isoleucine patch superfamily enzyme
MLKRSFLMIMRFVKGGVYYARKIGVQVGDNCRIYTTHFGSEPFLVSIGNHVTITSGVKLITHDGAAWLMRDEKGRRYVYQPIAIGNHVFIGVNSIVMPGVKIEDKVIVAAGSVVTKSVPSGVVVAGVPARIIGCYDDIEKKMLETYVSDLEMDRTLDYKEKILKVANKSFKPYLTRDI